MSDNKTIVLGDIHKELVKMTQVKTGKVKDGHQQ